MITLYSWRTSNGRKASIMLEECGLDYELRTVDIAAGEQHDPAFRAVSPNGRIPAIVDHDGPDGRPLALFESGAILLYLASRAGRFLPEDAAERWTAVQWLMWQMGGVGPQFGQAFHFLHQLPPGVPERDAGHCAKRYVSEVRRLCGVMETRLGAAPHLAGADYSVADISVFPWIALHGRLGIRLEDMPRLAEWYATIRERPAVRRGMDVPGRLPTEQGA